MKKIFLLLGVITAFAACNKDKFKTEPQVEIKSISPSQVNKGQMLKVAATIRDKEGDLQDSLLVVRKWFSNGTLLNKDTLRYTLSGMAFPTKTQIEVEVLFAYGELVDGTIYLPLEQVDKEFAAGFIMRDKAGHRSEYVESETVTLKKL